MDAKRRLSHKSVFNENVLMPPDTTEKVRQWIYSLPYSPRNAYLQWCAFSKFVGDETDPAQLRADRAIDKWLAQEANNLRTNERLESPNAHTLAGVGAGRFIAWAQRFITSVIGETVPLDALNGAFSGGASTSRRRTEGHPAFKFVGRADITSSALKWFELVREEYPLWMLLSPPDLTIVRGSKLFTVPKNSLIDRVCCKEPDINMFLQRGVGSYIRRRLRSFGVNLNDQTRNQRLARQGSLHGRLATLDLSSASDSISDALVSLLLPHQWYSCLDDLRSHYVEVRGEEHSCEMFSSMGNGFTFELESLLFFAIAKTVAYFTGTRGTISVYGDDIIVPVEIYAPLVEVLDFFGFSVNLEKSYSKGPFRESCGGHYWNGEDITPFFVKEPILTLSDLIHCLNQIRKWSGNEFHGLLSHDFELLWFELAQLVPLKFWGGRPATAGRYSLVTWWEPKRSFRLSPLRRREYLPELGRYLSTMHASSESDTPLEEISSVRLLDVCRSKRQTHLDWHVRGNPFLSELTDRVSSE